MNHSASPENSSRYIAEIFRQHAKDAGLRYMTDEKPGITRKPAKKGFRYFTPDGDPVTDAGEIARINKLAVPPAYTDVWISPSPKSHLQATGRDARKRKQYRYHPLWQDYRNSDKFHHLAEFGAALPEIRQRLKHDLRSEQLSHDRVLALVLTLIDETAMRIGNDVYARENGTYGITTLQKKHVETDARGHITFEFPGKHKKQWHTSIASKRLAKAVHQCEELPGQALFQYVGNHGERHPVSSEEVNRYLSEISGKSFTAKDFRTWTATRLAIAALLLEEPAPTATALQRQVNTAVKAVAAELGHTPAICRKCYIYPRVLSAFGEGTLHGHFDPDADPQAFEQCVIEFLNAA